MEQSTEPRILGMNPAEVPAAAEQARPECTKVQMGPPRGVSDQVCGTAEMLIQPPGHQPAGIGAGRYAYFQPTAEQLAVLNAGGFLELAQYGGGVVPFGLQVFTSDEDSSGEQSPDAIASAKAVLEEMEKHGTGTTIYYAARLRAALLPAL
jgi:hypothetical protein